MRPAPPIHSPAVATTTGDVFRPPLRESVAVSRALDGEIALLDIGCGRVVVVDEEALGALTEATGHTDGLYAALQEAGFIAAADSVADTR